MRPICCAIARLPIASADTSSGGAERDAAAQQRRQRARELRRARTWSPQCPRTARCSNTAWIRTRCPGRFIQHHTPHPTPPPMRAIHKRFVETAAENPVSSTRDPGQLRAEPQRRTRKARAPRE